jgi:regulatory protein
MPESCANSDLDGLTEVKPVEIRVAAMDLLARREHSRLELLHKLKRRFDNEEMVEAQLLRLREDNLQSDRRFAESFVRQRAARGKGPLRLRQEMRERGISDTDIEQAMAESDVDWHEVAAAVLVKKFGEAAAPDMKEKARRARFMQYRGFSGDHYRGLI